MAAFFVISNKNTYPKGRAPQKREYMC